MNIEQAKAMAFGARVWCPADRGVPGFFGTVRLVGEEVSTNVHDTPYVWIHVHQPGPNGGRSAVWPSNRLSY